MKAFDTVTEAITDLTKRGYDDQLILARNCLVCEAKQQRLEPDQFTIDEFYRFEGDSNPDDEMIVYAISSKDGNVKGTLVNAFGMYADSANDNLISKLNVRNK